MQFRLGEFEAFDLGALGALAEGRESGALGRRVSASTEFKLRMIRELTESGDLDHAMMLAELVTRSHGSRRAPCLLEAVPVGHRDHDWLADVLAALRSVSATDQVSLQACEAQLDDGPSYQIVAVAQGRRAEVRHGDVVQAGFALSATPDEGLSIRPRIFRVVCANGTVMSAGVLAERRVEPAEAGEIVTELLGKRVLDEAAARLALATTAYIEDPLVVLLRARVVSNVADVRSEFERAGDRSGWGLINAVTAVARRTQDWRRRLEQEGDAAGILAVLERDPDSRLRGAAQAVPRGEHRVEVHA